MSAFGFSNLLNVLPKIRPFARFRAIRALPGHTAILPSETSCLYFSSTKKGPFPDNRHRLRLSSKERVYTQLGNDLFREQDSPITRSRKERRSQEALDHFGPLPPEAVQLREDLISSGVDPLAALKDRIDRQDASLATIRVCLEVAYDQNAALKRRDRVATSSSRRRKLVAHALSYTWSDIRIWLQIVEHDRDATFHLCYFAILEGLDEFVESWIKEHISREVFGSGPQALERAVGWRTRLFEGLMEAHSYAAWGSGDQQIRSLLRLTKWRTEVTQKNRPIPEGSLEARDHFANWINLFPGVMKTASTFCSGCLDRTSPRLFEEFQQLYKHFIGSKVALFDLARLELYHPTASVAQPFLILSQEIFGRSSEASVHFHDDDRLRLSFQKSMRRAHAVSKALGQSQEANQIADYYTKLTKSTIEEDLKRVSSHERFTVNFIRVGGVRGASNQQ